VSLCTGISDVSWIVVSVFQQLHRVRKTDIRVESAEGSKPTHSVETYGENITMAWSPNGKHIVLGNRSDRILWIDTEEQKVIRRENMTLEVRFLLFPRAHNSSFFLYRSKLPSLTLSTTFRNSTSSSSPIIRNFIDSSLSERKLFPTTINRLDLCGGKYST